MFVRDYMSSPVTTVTADMPFQDALRLMQEKNFRRLPVIDKKGKLIGIVSERDLLFASPSQATALSVHEMHYLLSKINVEKLMTKKVVIANTADTIEDVAAKMVENNVGGVPIVDAENYPVGMITETDIFKLFVELFSGGESGLRLTLAAPNKKGVLAQLGQAILDLGGNIINVNTFNMDDPELEGLVIKVQDVSKEQLVDTLEALGDHVIDAREV